MKIDDQSKYINTTKYKFKKTGIYKSIDTNFSIQPRKHYFEEKKILVKNYFSY